MFKDEAVTLSEDYKVLFSYAKNEMHLKFGILF